MNQTKYVGLDVHKSSISIAVLDAEGNLIIESTIKTDSLTLIDFFQGLTGAIHATFEEGCQAQWLFDILSPIVSKLIVCNPKKNHLLHSANKGDKLDAKNLAHLLRSGSLKAVFHSCVSTKTLKEKIFLDIPFHRTSQCSGARELAACCLPVFAARPLIANVRRHEASRI